MTTPKIKIMAGVSWALARSGDKELITGAGVFYVLKAMHRDGIIRNWESKISQLADACHMSRNTLKKYAKFLLKKGLAKLGTKGKLILSSFKYLHNMLKLQSGTKDHYRSVVARADYIIRALAIYENFQYQERKIKQKLEATRQLGGVLPGNTAEAREAELNRMIAVFKLKNEPAQIYEFSKAQLAGDISYQDQLDLAKFVRIGGHGAFVLNPDVSMSQKRLAGIYQCSSQASGHYWQQKLQKLGLIKVKPRRVESLARSRYSPLGYVFYSRATKSTVLVLHNEISFT